MPSKHKNIGLALWFWMVILFLYLPLFYLICQTFLKNPNDWGGGFTFKWILQLLNSRSFLEPLFTSLEIAVCSATLAVILGTMGATGLFKNTSNLSISIQSLIVLPILLPEVITGLSLLLFFLLIRIPLGFMTVILAHASFSASFVYFIMLEQLRKLDPQMSEAALDLGAEPAQVFWKITLPNILPGIFAGWLFAFTLSFDDFLISFFTSGATLNTLPLKIYSLMRMGISPELNGLSFVLICITTALVLILASKESSRQCVLKG